MSGSRTDRVMRWIERAFLIVGASCLLWAATTSLSAIVYQAEQTASLNDPGPNASELRVESAAPIGHLEIPRLGLSVVVAEGDDEKTLKVAVGHLPDTPYPWQPGNSALAGHRDSFFRPLQRIHVGDAIRLATRHGIFRYRVTRHMVVSPDELWVLDPAATADLTLITCYPFDFVGPAPLRFIVHAERVIPE